jgi:pimeloyl-ACP methyl ester carboxylesterase
LLGTQAGVEDPDKVATYQVMLDVWETEGLNDQLAETIAAIILGNDWDGRGPWIAKWHQKPRSLLRQAFQTLVTRDDIHHRLGEIKAPTLVIHGTADAAIDIEKAQRLCSELANCEQVIAIEGGGHAANLTHPKLVNLAVEEFLNGPAFTPPRAERRLVVERRTRERRESAHRESLVPVDRRQAERRSK